MSHRVIAGSAKGRRLKPVPGDTTRPIMDKVKEALFSILGSNVIDSTWLDLFAGTGAVGIEALSRGAEFVRFIDLNRAAVRTIHENLTTTGFQEKAEVLHNDALSYLKQTHPRAFEVVYIAPPQYHSLWKKALLSLDANPAHLTPEALVIVQIDPTERETLALEHLELYDERRYGKTLLMFFEELSHE